MQRNRDWQRNAKSPRCGGSRAGGSRIRRPPTRALESGLDLPASIGFALIRPPVRPTKDVVVSMGKPLQRLNDTRVKGDASWLTVLRGEKLDLSADEVDLPPIEIEGFRNPSARVEQENDEWSQVREHAWIKRSASPGVTQRTLPLGCEGRSTWRHSQRPRYARFNTADIGVYICLFRVEFLASGFRLSAAQSIAAWSILASGFVPK